MIKLLPLASQIDLSVYLSLAFLFGIAAQFKAMDGYSFLRRIILVSERKIGILFTVILVTTLFSPFILNDVVVIILTPAIVRYSKHFRADIAPLIVAEIAFTNIASSITPFGNPQNILLWSASKATFAQFVAGTWFQLLLSGVLCVLVLLPFRRKFNPPKNHSQSNLSKTPAIYLGAVTTIVVVSSLLLLPSYLSLGLAFVSGFFFTFRSLRQIPIAFDYRSLLILYGFVASITIVTILFSGILTPFLAPVSKGVQPYSAIFIGVTSNIISNVPATQLLVSSISISPAVAPKLAVEAGLAGNIDPIASFANLLALLMVKREGLPIRRTIALQLVVGLIAFLPAFL